MVEDMSSLLMSHMMIADRYGGRPDDAKDKVYTGDLFGRD